MNRMLLAVALWLAPLVALGGEAEVPPEDAAQQKLIAALRTKKVTFDFVETPLADVMNFLQALLDVNLIVDPGLDRDQVVTLRVNDMAAGQALQWIARMVGGRVDVRDGAVVLERARPDEPGFAPRRPPEPPGPPWRPVRPFGKATLALGPGLTIELELHEDDLRPEVRQLILFLVNRQLLGEAQKQDPKAVKEFMDEWAKRRQAEADERQRAEAARRRAEEEARKGREKQAPKPEPADPRKGQL